MYLTEHWAQLTLRNIGVCEVIKHIATSMLHPHDAGQGSGQTPRGISSEGMLVFASPLTKSPDARYCRMNAVASGARGAT